MKSAMKKWAAGSLAAAVFAATPVWVSAAGDTGWTQKPGLYEVHTWAGKSEWGHENGAVGGASFFFPRSVLVLPDGRLLVADSGNHSLRALTAAEVSAYAGLDIGEDATGLPLGGYNDDEAGLAAFSTPSGLALDKAGNIYVADFGNNAVRKIAPDGTVTTLAGNGKIGSADGKAGEATFWGPSDVAVDGAGNVYVADTLNHVIRKIASDGTVTTLTAESTRAVEYVPGAVEATGDFLDGPITQAKFNEPSGLALDAEGDLYVSDRGNRRIRKIDFGAGTVTTIAGGGTLAANAVYAPEEYVDGPAAASRFKAPEGLLVLEDGSVVVADGLGHSVRLIQNGVVSTIAGVGDEFGKTDGVSDAAQFNHPTDVALLADGRLVVADEYGNKLRVLQKYAAPAKLPANQAISVIYNGVTVQTSAAPLLKSNAVLLPVRSLGNALGFKVEYDKTTKTALLTKDNTVYKIQAGLKTVAKTTDGTQSTVALNAPAYLENGAMYLPVRFFAEESGLDVRWDAAIKLVVIRNKTF